MKKLLFLTLLIITACKLKEQKIDGAYILVSAKYGDSALSKEKLAAHKTIRVFKKGYWVNVTYSGHLKTTVETAIGGTYIIKNDSCTEMVNFFSEDNSMVGRIQSSEYSLDGSKYFRRGKMDNSNVTEEEYNKIITDTALKDTSLEGVWKRNFGEWFGDDSKKDTDFMQFKIYAYPNFVWAQYHVKGKDFIGVGGGTYQYDGKKLVEHVEYISYARTTPGNLEINVTKLPSNQIKQETADGAGKEIWEKIQ